MTSYFAHSENSSGVKHDLITHLRRVAELAGGFAAKFSASSFGYYAGLWHDLGKFTQAFQDYLASPEKHSRTDHSTAGAIHCPLPRSDRILGRMLPN